MRTRTNKAASRHVFYVAMLLIPVTRLVFSQEARPCPDAEKYEEIHFGLDAKPLVLARIQGRTVIQTISGEVRAGEIPQGICLSLFTADSHRYVRTATTDDKGHFDFGPVSPGSYRLIARASGFCTGNIAVKVTRPSPMRHKPGIIVYFQLARLDVCTGADYDRK
jgi:hypothetical protein